MKVPLRPWLRLWPLWLGALLLAGLWLGPLPQMSRTAFSPHMMLHLGVVSLAAPPVAFGLVRLGFGPRGNSLLLPLAILASVLDLVVVWGWHAPLLHEKAALVPELFVAQQLSFLAAGVLLWIVAFAPGSGRAGAASGAFAMFMTFIHMSMLGIVIATAPRLLYPPELCGGAFGLAPLADQQAGGVMMAVGGSLPYLAGGLFLAWRLLNHTLDPKER